MGEVQEGITLVNTTDVINAGRGFMPETDIRQVTVRATVDTGAMSLVIGEETRERLGLTVMQESVAVLAGGTRQSCKITEPVTIRWKDRFTGIPAVVLAGRGPDGGEEVLLGVIPLEDMDLKVNPVEGCLEGAHGAEWVRYVRQAAGRLRFSGKSDRVFL